MEKVENPIYGITRWIMENLLQRFMFRLLANAITLGIVSYYLHAYCHGATEAQANYYQNVWIYAAYIPSFLITGMIFWYVVVTSLSRDARFLINPILAAGVGTLFLFGLLFSPAVLGMDRDPTVYHLLALLIALSVLIIDYLIMRTGFFKAMERQWKSVRNFDCGIVLGTMAILIIGHFIRECGGPLLSAGFTGGGVAFQLLMSNLLFDPELYKMG